VQSNESRSAVGSLTNQYRTEVESYSRNHRLKHAQTATDGQRDRQTDVALLSVCVCMCVCVSAVGENLAAADGARVIDARGKLVMPGKTDTYCTHCYWLCLPIFGPSWQAPNCLICADVPLSNYSLTHSLTLGKSCRTTTNADEHVYTLVLDGRVTLGDRTAPFRWQRRGRETVCQHRSGPPRRCCLFGGRQRPICFSCRATDFWLLSTVVFFLNLIC